MRYLIFFILLSFSPFSLIGQIGDLHFLTPSSGAVNDAVDMDNDGDLDILSFRGPGNTYYACPLWYENVNGEGLIWDPHCIEVPDTIYYYGFRAVDITGDGWPDLVNKEVTLVHNGNATDIAFTVVPNNLDLTYSKEFRFGDLDSDGDMDIIVVDIFSNKPFRRYLNINQDGTFGAPEDIDTDLAVQHEVKDAKLIDVDQDMDLDIVTTIFESFGNGTDEGTYYVAWFENDGSGSFLNSHLIYDDFINDIPPYLFVEAGDFNGDNLIDVIFSDENRIEYFFQQSDGSWDMQFSPWGNYGSDLEVADFDNDGDLDFIEGNGYGLTDQVHWFENIDNTGDFTLQTFTDSFDVYGGHFFELGDYDNDGDVDIAFHNNTGGGSFDGLFMYRNNLNTAGTFNDVLQISENINGFLKPFPIDFDNDMDKDILIYAEPEQNYFWIENFSNVDSFSAATPIIGNELIATTLVDDLDGDGDEDVIAINENQELVWYENISVNTAMFGPKQILQTNILTGYLSAIDFDNDGDLDIAAQTATTSKAMYWFEQESSNNFLPHLISDASPSNELITFADLNGDGLTDVVYNDTINSQPQLRYFEQEVGGTFISNLLYDGFVFHLEVVDIEDDQDQDLVVYVPGSNYKFKLLLNEQNDFDEYPLINPSVFYGHFKVLDMNNDGKKDIYMGKSWSKQLNSPTNFSEALPLMSIGGAGYLEVSDLDGNGIDELLFSYSTDVLACAESQLSEGSWMEGYIAFDQDLNCELDPSIDTSGLYGWIVELERNGTTYYASTNLNGYYAAFLPDSGDYVVHVNIPNNYFSTCYNDTLVMGVNPFNVTYLDFPLQIEHECPLMQVEMTTGNLRPCMEGNISIQYCNEGTILAEDAQVEIMLDEFLLFNSASLPFTETDSSYIFEVGEVGILDCGNIQISVTPDCDSTQVGDIVCANAFISPDSLCTPLDSLWDESNIIVSGFCENDTVYFELENTGAGAMSEARQFRIEIANDDILLMMYTDTFFLDSDEKKLVVLAAEMEALRIEADQDENHPLLTTASTLVSECADLNLPANLFPQISGDPFTANLCRTLTGAYDPNDKTVIPAGFSAENFIDREWELEYNIRFQNTGNDTAFTVVLVDTISEHLDLSTLRIGSASHDFVWSLNVQRELTFKFNNILLPDSTTNEIASHGYVQFFLTPEEEIPFGTLVENQAAIYFDYNDPIFTNTVSQTIRMPVFATSEHVAVCTGSDYEGTIILEDILMVDSTLTNDGLYLDFYHITALPVFTENIAIDIPYGDIFNGIEITSDTIIEVTYTSVSGCDSIVVNNVSVIVSVKTLQNEYEIYLYPQPAGDQLYLQWDEKAVQPTGLSLMGTDGVVLQDIKIESGVMVSPHAINLATLSEGVYWLGIDNIEGERIFKKIVKI